MKHTIETLESRLQSLVSSTVSGSDQAITAESPSSPTDQVLLQQQGQQQFLGNLLWDAFNLITFGAFEKKKEKKAPEQPQP